ncbi:hypothetical protein F66182_771 [Fusarium sp. NRRL 66182]|nr:hypothetical protein F66182_771 [Fusarium sp. NRRL 66182]
MLSRFQPLSLAFLAFLSGAKAQENVEEALSTISVTNINDIRGHIHLPSTSNGHAVSWRSSDPDVVSNNGLVTRQESDTDVLLVASIEIDGQVHEREFNASVHQRAQLEPFEAYAFSYFTGNSRQGENIFFAASNGNNALDWQELNNAQPVIRSQLGTRGLRDPFIIRSPEGDTFYLIATDLSIGSGTSWGDAVRKGSLYLEVWESHDLVEWSAQRHVKVSPDNAGNTWAPEAFWDAERNSYVVFWASSLYDDPEHAGNSYHRMLYSLTRDFVTFSEPEIWQDSNASRIDTTVVQEGSTFYRFTKDEGSVSGCTDIIQEKSTSLLAQVDGWTVQATCIGADAGLAAVEGPTAFKSNPGDVNGEKFYLFVDEYGRRGYLPLETEDLENPSWKTSADYNLPTSPRHGTVLPITAKEHARLLSAFEITYLNTHKDYIVWHAHQSMVVGLAGHTCASAALPVETRGTVRSIVTFMDRLELNSNPSLRVRHDLGYASSMKLSNFLLTALAAGFCHARNVVPRRGRPLQFIHDAEKRDLLQDIVTWDEHTLFIHGERVTLFSAEIHPFRLPVASLYLDLFHKVKAMGFNMVSFYVDWALLEGKPGEFRSQGALDLQPFIDAAKEAGLYLLARPGPYINAEVSGGGFPGWLQRVKGVLRTNASDYLRATDNYMASVGSIIAKAQITNGGPVILFQPENEYSAAVDTPFPSHSYLKYVNDQARNAGVVVPLINNDAWPGGTGAPGSGPGAVDIYGHDGYPGGFDCANPYNWSRENFPLTWHADHERISPSTPYTIPEFQGGAFDPPGGAGFDKCYELTNHEFARVYYKNNLAAGVTIFNIYMTFGGTNWGNLGHTDGYTSYDYGASISEDRTITREKYSEIKLQGQFLRVSPAYAISEPNNLTTTKYTDNKEIAVTALTSKKDDAFYIVRHADHRTTTLASYKLNVPTSAGTLTIPQLGGSLSLTRRDSKIHVVDYAVGKHTLLYSTAEVFTWKKFADKTVLVLYGGPDELHEVAVKGESRLKLVQGDGVKLGKKKNAGVLQFKTSSTRRVVQAGSLHIYLLDRNAAYRYWVPDLPGKGNKGAYGTSVMNPDSVIVNGAYLVRSVAVQGSRLSLQADFNATTPLEVIGAPKGTSRLVLNGKEVQYRKSKLGNWIVNPDISLPSISVPDLESLDWRYIDALPEVKKGYDDSKWTVGDHKTTNNLMWPLQNSVSLYASDYGFHAGALIYRGHFTASGSESKLKLWTAGGKAFGTSVWLDDKFLGSFAGHNAANHYNSTFDIPKSQKGSKHVITVLIDNMGLRGNWAPGLEEMKEPRGILDWALLSSSGKETNISKWKLTGNLGGEDYVDKFRGPLNEGGFFHERQGYHLPSPPLDQFKRGSPFKGIDKPGVAFYSAKLPLKYPADKFDIPLSFNFKNNTESTGAYRAFLFVNGFQYGRFTSNVGPQTVFPVPEGVLNYDGDNWIGLTLWALEDGAKVEGFSLTAGHPVQTGREPVEVVKGPSHAVKVGRYDPLIGLADLDDSVIIELAIFGCNAFFCMQPSHISSPDNPHSRKKELEGLFAKLELLEKDIVDGIKRLFQSMSE